MALIEPWTRHIGAVTGTGARGSIPATLDGGDTLVAAVIVASPNVLRRGFRNPPLRRRRRRRERACRD